MNHEHERLVDEIIDERIDIPPALDITPTSKVKVQRWSGLDQLVGPNVFIITIEKAAAALAMSGFMRPWIENQIADQLRLGAVFINHGATMQDDEPAIVPNGRTPYMRPRSEYRMATSTEVLDYVDTARLADLSGHRVSKRSQEKAYVLHYHEGAHLIERYDKLPNQAKIILDLLNDTGRENFTEASIELILTENKEELRTKQEPMKVFAFYRHRFIEEGHLEEIGGGE